MIDLKDILDLPLLDQAYIYTFIIKNPAPFNSNHFTLASQDGNIEAIRYLKEKKQLVAFNVETIISAAENGHGNILEYLESSFDIPSGTFFLAFFNSVISVQNWDGGIFYEQPDPNLLLLEVLKYRKFEIIDIDSAIEKANEENKMIENLHKSTLRFRNRFKVISSRWTVLSSEMIGLASKILNKDLVVYLHESLKVSEGGLLWAAIKSNNNEYYGNIKFIKEYLFELGIDSAKGLSLMDEVFKYARGELDMQRITVEEKNKMLDEFPNGYKEWIDMFFKKE